MKKQAPVLARKQKNNEVNKKAIIWTASVAGVIIVLTAVLLIVNG
jgi:hypothetical protein